MVLTGGHAIRYASALTLDLRRLSVGDQDPIKREEGIKVACTVRKNHCVPSKNPYVRAEYYAIFGEGIEQYLSLLAKAISQGILLQSGAFIRDPDENGDPRVINDDRLQWQGRARARQYLIDNPDYFEDLKKRVSGQITDLSLEEIQEIEKEEIELEKKAAAAKKKKDKQKKK